MPDQTILMLADAVRTAVYGSQVREAIAEAILKIQDAVDIQSEINAIKSAMGYSNIKSFKATPASLAYGDQGVSVVLSWQLNVEPTSMTINGEPVTGRSKTVSIRDDGTHGAATYTLTVDGDSKTVTIPFYPKAYYGKSKSTSAADASFVTGLGNSKAISSRVAEYQVSGMSSDYFYVAYPTDYGQGTFYYGQQAGGFNSPQTLDIGTVSYYVYRSTNPLSGTVKISVK